MRLTAETATQFTRIALGHVAREYPHKLDHVLTSDADALAPRILHPIFHGSFDWHSCVHGYWTLARCLRRFPERPECAEVRALFDAVFTAENVAAERTYIERPSARGFERPYGWAWLLMLAAELRQHKCGRGWAAALQPLADAFVQRFESYLPLCTYPVRAGVHANTAFALALADEYCAVADAPNLRWLLRNCARRWHLRDAACQAWEPSQDEFLSPALMEAEAMRRLLDPEEFARWFAAFLPDLDKRQPETLFRPARVSDRTDGKIAHLDGLNLSRAWCWRRLSTALDGDRKAVALEAAEKHLAASIPHIAGDYMGEHWLASFALLALEA